MTDQKSFFEKADVIRHRLLSHVRQLTETGRSYELPPPSEELGACTRLLEENIYQVLVIGEAKRGKSSLVNALIGESLLPTDVDIATSQVFRIQPSDKRAAQLRFEDDSTKPIQIDELARYGSQVVADAEGLPLLDQIIRWIEIETPCHFIPPNVRLLDTPGLGALYAHHSQITRRFIPHADAVLFVLESQAPISEPELAILDEILGVTRNVFFVQTKIDQFRRDEWENVRRRNEEILRARFGTRLNDIRVWPVSNSNLMKAAQTKDEDYELISRGRELITALQQFLFNVACITRAALVVTHAQRHLEERRAILVQRLQTTKDSGADIERSLAELQRRQRELESLWGPQGSSRKNCIAKIKEGVRVAEKALRSAISDIQRETITQFQSATSVRELQSVGNELPQEVSRKISQAWEAVCKEFQDYCVRQLGALSDDLRNLNAIARFDSGEMPIVLTGSFTIAPPKNEFGGILETIINKGTKPGIAGGLLSYLGTLSFPILGTLFWPLLPIGLGIIGWGIFDVFMDYRQRQKLLTQEVKADLIKQVKGLFSKIEERLFEPSLSGLQFRELLEQYVNKIEEKINDAVRERLESLRKEIDDMRETLKLTSLQKDQKAEEIEKQIQNWDQLAIYLNMISGELVDLGRS